MIPPRTRTWGRIWMLGLGLCALLATSAHAQAPKEDLKDKKDQVRRLGEERIQIEAEMQRFSASEKEMKLEVENLSQAIRDSRSRKMKLLADIAIQQANKKALEKSLAALRGTIRGGKNRIALRMRRLYRVLKAQQSASLYQMANNRYYSKDSHYLALMQRSDQQALKAYNQLYEERRENQNQLARSLEYLEQLRVDLEQESDVLAERQGNLRDSMDDITRNRKLYSQYLEEIGKAMEGMQSTISSLEETQRNNAVSLHPTTVAGMRGTLDAPVKGSLIAAFGQQDPRYNLKKFQRGVVIRVAESAEVRSVAQGTAVHAGPFRGYQSLVVLDHGNGVFTVYGHMEDLRVQRGMQIAPGTVLGRATYQPLSDAHDVYFELRLNGQPQDPMEWLLPNALR